MTVNNISVETLADGEVTALDVIEIMSIPHVSILNEDRNTVEEIVEKYKNEMTSLLNEVYQAYKSSAYNTGYSTDISLELLLATEPVANQPYNAKIRLFIIVRAIAPTKTTSEQSVETITQLCQSMLTLQKYEFSEIEYAALSNLVLRVNNKSIKAIVKEEKVENLQNQLLPYCYTFDRLPESCNDLSKLVNVLIDYPHCAVSLQLIPVVYEMNEMGELDRITQILETLSRGVNDQGIGNISFALAEKHAATFKYYSQHKTSSLFAFNILIYGDNNSAANIANRFFGQLSSGKNETANLKMVDLNIDEVGINNNFYPLPWAVNEVLLNKGRYSQIWTSGQFSEALYRLPYIITADEASEFFRLPIGSEHIDAGLVVNESEKISKTYTDNIINSGDITVGKLKSSSNDDTIGFALKDLAKHMLVVGTPGSGKTTFSVSLLDRLWKKHGIPFLVIEPAKNEYRALVQSIPELQVFTPGKNFISPFIYNPFIPPHNVKLETYKSTLKTAFSAAVSMSTPLDKIFEESINNCYSDFGWLDSYTVDDKGKIFSISDFIKCFEYTFEEIGYTGDAKNIGRAGLVRLKSLVNLFDNYFSIPIEDLLSKPTVIELAAIENADQKALLISLLLLSILAYVNANYIGEGGLRNVILLEEAHVLLDANTNMGQGEANPSAIAQGLVKRMLAEIRSYGVGLVIADQSPRKVSTDVVALTDMKVVFRLVESEDKQIIADSTNMSGAQIQRMSKLKPGEAFLFFNKLDEPEEVITPDYRLDNNIKISLSDDGIKQLSKYWLSKKEKTKPYPQCEYCMYCASGCDYERRILAREIARRIYRKYFKPGSTDVKAVVNVFGKITSVIRNESNGEPVTPEVIKCTKVHLWRKIKYETDIVISDKQISNSLSK